MSLLHNSTTSKNLPEAFVFDERSESKTGAQDGQISWYNANISSIQQIRGLQPVTAWSSPDLETGEIVPFFQDETQLKKLNDPKEIRLERFFLQSAARRLLWGSRTAKCLQLRQKDKKLVEVWKSTEHKSTHYAGLQTCASVWACPVCAAKISERRKLLLQSSIEQHKSKGGDVLLLTLTNPHTLTDNLDAMLKAQALAMSRFTSNRSSKDLFDSIGCIGTVRAWEVTHGANGWHPHFHILVFCDSGLDLEPLQSKFYAEWANACRLAKLPIPSVEHGVKLDNGQEASNYVAKGVWGLESEMTKGHIKKAKKGRSPFDLLRSYAYDDDKQAAALFIEYAKAFKGKNQLSYSKGLKELLQVDDVTDAELAAKQEDDAVLLGNIEFEEWCLIIKHELRGEVLELARHGWEHVRKLIDDLIEVSKDRKIEGPHRRPREV